MTLVWRSVSQSWCHIHIVLNYWHEQVPRFVKLHVIICLYLIYIISQCPTSWIVVNLCIWTWENTVVLYLSNNICRKVITDSVADVPKMVWSDHMQKHLISRVIRFITHKFWQVHSKSIHFYCDSFMQWWIHMLARASQHASQICKHFAMLRFTWTFMKQLWHGAKLIVCHTTYHMISGGIKFWSVHTKNWRTKIWWMPKLPKCLQQLVRMCYVVFHWLIGKAIKHYVLLYHA